MVTRINIDLINAQVDSILTDMKRTFISSNTNITLPQSNDIQVSGKDLEILNKALKLESK